MSFSLRAVILGAVVSSLASAQGTPPDSAAADSARRLSTVRVSVTRSDERAIRLPWAVSVLSRDDIRRGQATLGVDEALNQIPGVFASNRYIYALDQLRLSVRGAGARANFGARGVKILVDGVSQTLPDGQSQMTNVELGTIGRIEVLRGAASSLYGNGSGGVISMETDMRAPDRLRQDVRVVGGSFGMSKWQARTIGRSGDGRIIGALSVSRTTLDGFRQHSAADVRQINGAANVTLGNGSVFELRANAASMPNALNPGALTEAEWSANPDSAVATNVLRGASKDVSQQQYSVGWRGVDPLGNLWRTVAFLTTRRVENPLGAQPAPPRVAANGTLVTLNRRGFGFRADAARTLGDGDLAPRLSFGFDAQRSRDIRANWRTTGGQVVAADDTLLVDQEEIASSFGPFAKISWAPAAPLLLSVGGRWDRHTFEARDHFLVDGSDDSGERTMSAFSGHIGASYAVGDWFVPYANIATAFETPTTTELQVRPDVLGGFNPDLDPQHIRTIELGARGGTSRTTYDVALFRSNTRDAIIQFGETQGRAFFRNAGSTVATGAELGLRKAVRSWFELRGAYTYAHYEFDEYRIPDPGGDQVLDGNRLAGVPTHFYRVGLRFRRSGAVLDIDHTWSDAVWADDANTIEIEDWARLDLRLSWAGAINGQSFAPFVGVNNVEDANYIGSVTLNGFGGRVRESAPRRNIFAGIDVGWGVVR